MSGLRVHVRTRSDVLDYRFLGAAQPQQRWWEKTYGRWTDFARPSIVVEPGRFFVSGIASGRTDSRGTRIHFALHAEVDPEEREFASRVLAYLCALLDSTGTLEEAGRCLDAPGRDAWHAAVQGDGTAVAAVTCGVMAVLSDWAGQTAVTPAPETFMMAGGEAGAFACLGGRAASVVGLENGRPERAVYLNLASSDELGSLQHHGNGIVCREVVRSPKRLRPLPAGAILLMGMFLVTWLVWLTAQ